MMSREDVLAAAACGEVKLNLHAVSFFYSVG
jgi:hypothetical protein